MKALLLVLLIAAAGLLGYALVRSDSGTAPSPDPSATSEAPRPKSPPPTATLTDQLKIFRSAFWRSPVAGDEILGAERREWSDADGLSKWQWFIALQPSAELLKYVCEDNAFGLTATNSAASIDNAPTWFAFESSEVEVLRSSTANLQFIFNESNNTLFATSSGNGFTRGASQRFRPMPPPNLRPPGRLPLTPPPSSPNAAQ